MTRLARRSGWRMCGEGGGRFQTPHQPRPLDPTRHHIITTNHHHPNPPNPKTSPDQFQRTGKKIRGRKGRASPPEKPQHLNARHRAPPVLGPLHPALVLRHREQLARAQVDLRRCAGRVLPPAAGGVGLDLRGEGAGGEGPRGGRHCGFRRTCGRSWRGVFSG